MLQKILFSLLITISSFTGLPVSTDEIQGISAEYIYMIDINNDTVLYEKNSEDRMYPASITKLMSAIVAIENSDNLDEHVLLTESMFSGLYEANASMAGFNIYDNPTIEDLLYGTLLPSGAECVYALGYHLFGSIDNYVEAMNNKASEIGMDNTHFTNPTGLHDDNHYSTCQDLYTLLRYCLNNDIFKEIFHTSQYISTPVNSHPEGLRMVSTSLALSDLGYYNIPGLYGAKTGYTNLAGRCLASYSIVNGMDVILIVGKAQPNQGAIIDTSTIINWFNDRYANRQVLDDRTLIANIQVLDSKEYKNINIYSDENIYLDLPIDMNISYNYNLPSELVAPISKGDVIGNLTVYGNNEVLIQKDIVSPSDIPYSSFEHYRRIITEFYNKYYPLVIGVFLVILTIFIKTFKKSSS